MPVMTPAATGHDPLTRMGCKPSRRLEWREYERRSPCMFVAVTKQYGHKGYQLSAERRHTTLAAKVRCIQCRDASALLASVADLARRIANDQPPALRIVTADNLDNGVAVRSVLLLLAAMQSEDEQQEAA